MNHHPVDSDSPFNLNEGSKVKTDFKTIGVIICAAIAGTLFYASVNAQLSDHALQISDIKDQVRTAAHDAQREREESIRFRQELTTKIDYLVNGRRGTPPPTTQP